MTRDVLDTVWVVFLLAFSTKLFEVNLEDKQRTQVLSRQQVSGSQSLLH